VPPKLRPHVAIRPTFRSCYLIPWFEATFDSSERGLRKALSQPSLSTTACFISGFVSRPRTRAIFALRSAAGSVLLVVFASASSGCGLGHPRDGRDGIELRRAVVLTEAADRPVGSAEAGSCSPTRPAPNRGDPDQIGKRLGMAASGCHPDLDCKLAMLPKSHWSSGFRSSTAIARERELRKPSLSASLDRHRTWACESNQTRYTASPFASRGCQSENEKPATCTSKAAGSAISLSGQLFTHRLG
jgi:hypothetical protein